MNWAGERHGVSGEPDFPRNRIETARFKLSENLSHSDDSDSAVAGEDRLLRHFEKKARLARGGIGSPKFEFGGGIERNGAKCVGTRLALGGGWRNRITQRRRRWNSRNRVEHVGIFHAAAA